MEGGGGRVDSPKGGAAGSSAGPVIDKTLDPLVKKWMDEKTTETKEKVEENKQKEQRRRYWLGACYLLAMGVCGIVLVALGSTLSEIAENCGTTATAVGSVFVTRGCGAIAGAISSAKLYEVFPGNRIITVTLTALCCLLVYMPFITEVWQLHVCFGLLGLSTAITDTGCQIMTRFVHGKAAGPWLGANTVSFGVSGALVPAIAYATDSLYWQYCTLAGVSLLGAVTLFLTGDVKVTRPTRHAPPPKDLMGPGVGGGGLDWLNQWWAFVSSFAEFRTEMVVANMVFWLIGGKVTATAYLESYVDDTGVISSSSAELLIMVLWIAITIGRVLGVVDQMFIDTPTLYHHLTAFLVGGVLSLALLLALPASPSALWVSMAAYGFFNGPTVAYCYDLVNRLTIPSERGMSIVMFGLNFGASLVPYIVSDVWNAGGGPSTLSVSIFLSMLVPLPLLYLTKVWRSDKSAYEPIPTSEAEAQASQGTATATVV